MHGEEHIKFKECVPLFGPEYAVFPPPPPKKKPHKIDIYRTLYVGVKLGLSQ